MGNILDIACYGSDGKKINHVTQWDKGQSVKFNKLGLADPPSIHWCNRMSNEAYNVQATINGDMFEVKIPNLLLQEQYPLIGYIYLYESNSISETIAVIRIPVKPRQKPSDYYYIDNVDKISLSTVEGKINQLFASRQAGIFQFKTGTSSGVNKYTVTFPVKFTSNPVVIATTNQVNPQNYSV